MTAPRSLWSQIVLLVVIITVCVFPFYWMVTTSLKTQIVALEADPASDQLKIQRLKRQKLSLKDEVSRLQTGLLPDIIA